MGERPRSGNSAPPVKPLPRGFVRHVGAVVPRVARPAFGRQSPATVQIMLDWASIVGPSLARETAPRQISAGTLTIACNGPTALELQHLAGALVERINTHVGAGTVQRLRFVRDSLPIAAPTPPASASTIADGRAEAAVDQVPEGALRDALLALGRAVLTRR